MRTRKAPHAFRITQPRSRCLRKLAEAGDMGIPALLAPSGVGALIAWDLAEEYVDGRRLLSNRIRLTEYGREITNTLILEHPRGRS